MKFFKAKMNKLKHFVLEYRLVLLLCVLGSVVRFIYGSMFHPWQASPDHIAWQIINANGIWSYDQLIYYPHEGGTILVSVLSYLIGLFSQTNSLLITAFLLDFSVRFIQLYVVKKIFSKEIVLIFGLWTLFSSPIILPWATVIFGLHSISSVFPFLLLYFLWHNRCDVRWSLRMGIFFGIIIWFNYTNCLLLVPFLLTYIIQKKYQPIGYVLITLIPILLLHFGIRYLFDPGFHLDNYASSSIRGESIVSLQSLELKQLVTVWYKTLADSSVAVKNVDATLGWAKYIWLVVSTFGFIGWYRLWRDGKLKTSVFTMLTMLFFFISLYSVSSFYFERDVFTDYVSYRHLTYILPLFMLVCIVGLSFFKQRIIGYVLYLFISFYAGIMVLMQPDQKNNGTVPAGWVLAKKLGHDPHRINEIILNSNYSAQDLYIGVGWGLSTGLLSDSTISQKVLDQRMHIFFTLINQFPHESKVYLLEGVRISFGEGITPKLRSDLLPLIEENLIE